MNIVITGSGGLIGCHLRFFFAYQENYRDGVVAVDRSVFTDSVALNNAVKDADVVIHCAGVNRGTDTEVQGGNVSIAKELVTALSQTSSTPHLLYMNSTHKAFDSPYAQGKRGAHEVFEKWATQNDALYTEFVLPHVFGEGGKPFYNSAIHSFCHQLANDEPMSVNGSGQLELIHTQEIAHAALDAIERKATGELRLPGVAMSVATAAGKLTDLYRSYTSDVIPDLRNPFDLRLFNTLRSFMYPKFYPKALKLNSDDRGTLFEAVKNNNGGQAFLSTTKPGITRGNHFHFNKVERFLVVAGDATIRIRALGSSHVEQFNVSGSKPAYVDMPTLHTHNITNTGKSELLTLFWSHEIFDPVNPDTYFQNVDIGEA